MLQKSYWSSFFNKVGNKGIQLLGKQYTLAMYCYSTLISMLISMVIAFDHISVLLGTAIYVVIWLVSSYVVVWLNDMIHKHIANKYDNKI